MIRNYYLWGVIIKNVNSSVFCPSRFLEREGQKMYREPFLIIIVRQFECATETDGIENRFIDNLSSVRVFFVPLVFWNERNKKCIENRF